MPHNLVDPRREFSSSVRVNKRDPQKIADLIEQLDLDLIETKTNTSRQR